MIVQAEIKICKFCRKKVLMQTLFQEDENLYCPNCGHKFKKEEKKLER